MPPATSSSPQPERRDHARQRVAAIAYVEIGHGNGGIVLNVSEGGLAVVAVSPIVLGDNATEVRFRLSPSSGWIEATGQLAWLDASRKSGGFRFVDLAESGRARLRQWIAADSAQAGAVPPALSPPLHVPASFPREMHEHTPPPTPAAAAPAFEPNRAVLPESPPVDAPGAAALTAIAAELAAAPATAAPQSSREPAAVSPPAYEPDRAALPVLDPRATSAALAARAEAFGRIGDVLPPRVARQSSIAAASSLSPAASAPLPITAPLESGRRVGRTVLLALLFSLVAFLFFVVGVGADRGAWSSFLAALDARFGVASNPAAPTQPSAEENSPPASESSAADNQNAALNTNGNANTNATPSAPPSNAGSAGAGVSSEGPSEPAAATAPAAPAPAPPPLPVASASAAAPRSNASPRQPASIAEPRSSLPAPIIPAAPSVAPPPAAAVSPSRAAPSASAATPAPSAVGAVDVVASPYPSLRIPPGLSAQASDPATPIHIGSLIARVEPVYPLESLERGTQGAVQLRVLIARDGSVFDVQLASGGPDPLAEAARLAIAQWHFEPSSIGGQPVEAEERVTVNFRLVNRPPASGRPASQR